MSDIDKVTDKEAMEALQKFANACYREGLKDSAISVGIGVAFVLICGGAGVVSFIIKEKIKDKKEKRNK